MSRLQNHSNRRDDISDSLIQQAPSVAPGKQPLVARIPTNGQPVQRQEDASATVDEDPAAQLTIEDVRYEIIAHNFGYQDSLAGARGELLQRWGYQPEWAARINDARTGFFCGLIMPDENHPELTPILVFRGTEGASDLGDLISDMNPVSVGYNQFHENRAFVGQLISEAGGTVNTTGHSLGGALAQHAAAAFTGSVQQVFTYQAPAIEASAARRVAESPDAPEVRHHIAAGDLVDNAGDAHLAGEFFRHDVGGGPGSHVRYLFSTPEFAAHREALGITDDILQNTDPEQGLGITPQTTQSPVEHSSEYPDPIFCAVSEGVRRTVGGALYPILNGLNVLFSSDDTEIGEQITGMDPSQLAGLPVSERAYMVGRLCRGVTGNADEEAILRLLAASTSDAAQVIDVVGAHVIAENLHGEQYDTLAAFYRSSYYPSAPQQSLVQLIQDCMDGRTSEWEEEIIADILVSRSDGRAIITRIGAIYEGGGFAEGLNKVQWQLDGGDQRRVDAIYAND